MMMIMGHCIKMIHFEILFNFQVLILTNNCSIENSIMHINFVDHALRPRIYSDKVSCDNYEVSNLISSNSLGFLAESFIKPPATITIVFPCNINIERILINSKVGSQQSTGFEIYTASMHRASCWLMTNASYDSFPEKHSDLTFLRVGRGYDASQHIYTFLNSRFQGEKKLSQSSDGMFNLNHHFDKHLSSVSAVAVRITSTLNGSAIAVRSIEVWASPASDTPKDILAQIRLLHSKKLPLLGDFNVTLPQGDVIKSSSGTIDDRNADILVEIPTEYLDAITHNLMSLPVLLPCGQTIDQTTLDRYVQEEAIWGRAPSDPFTGKVFGLLHRPMQNMPLKMRLDDFVQKNKDNLSTQLHECDLQMLGRGSINSNQNCSRLVEKSKKFPVTDIANETVLHPVKNSNKRMKLDTTCTTVSAVGGNALLPPNSQNIISVHENKIANSLDTELKSVLSLLPSFTNNSKIYISGNEKSQITGCSTCRKETVEQLYQLSCSHNICRDCLLHVMKEGGQSSCHCCGKTFYGHNVTKIHLSKSDFFI